MDFSTISPTTLDRPTHKDGPAVLWLVVVDSVSVYPDGIDFLSSDREGECMLGGFPHRLIKGSSNGGGGSVDPEFGRSELRHD